jgi:hypothetical protein
VSRHVAKPEILDEPVAARTPEQARIAENCRVNNHAAGPNQRGNLARLRLEFASVVRRMKVECPPAAHRARAVAVEKFSDRSRLKILVVVDENGQIMALLGDFARQVKSPETTDIPLAVMDGDRYNRFHYFRINFGVIGTIVPD